MYALRTGWWVGETGKRSTCMQHPRASANRSPSAVTQTYRRNGKEGTLDSNSAHSSIFAIQKLTLNRSANESVGTPGGV